MHGASKRFGATVACDDLNLSMPSGELVALLGPSGSGKTTLLRALLHECDPSERVVVLEQEPELLAALSAGVDDFNQEFTELLNTYCWNDIWNRPGLPRKTRSVLNLGMLCALGKEHELKLHIRGALNNGLTREEIKEVFLQVAIYCGVPAAVVAFRCAKEVFQS